MTTCVVNREPVFRDLFSARHLINALRTEDRLGRTETIAFVVMPDHLHWLLMLTGKADLSNVVGSVKSITARKLGRPIWQDGFHDHALRRDEDLKQIARYIIGNPLRKGLVTSIADYPHWDAMWL